MNLRFAGRQIFLMLTIILWAGFVSAQEPETELSTALTDELQGALEDAGRWEYAQRSIGSPSAVESVQTDPITVEAGQANGKGTISWKPNGDCELMESCWALNLSAPVDEDSEISDFTSLDDLAKDFAAGFDWRKVSSSSEEELLEFFKDLDALCDALDLKDSCDHELIAQKIKGKSSREIARLSEKMKSYLRKAVTTWSVGGKVSYNDYEFFDDNAEEDKADEFGASLKLTYARIVGEAGRVAFSVEGQRSIKESETKVQHCKPVEGSAIFESCKELPLGSPVAEEGVIPRIEYRHHFTNFVVSPLLSYNLNSDVFGVELPVYFIRDSEGGFAGGFRLGWRSDGEKPVASVFVSKRLGFLGI